MRFTDLYGAEVRTGDGRAIGCVHEIHCAADQITHLGVGEASLLERLTGGRRGRRIPWSAVKAVVGGEILVEL